MTTKYILFLLMACAIGSGYAQDKSNDTTARYFIIQVSIGNLQEVAMSRIAAERATRQEVRTFAQRMIADHGKAETQLMQLIRTRGFNIPSQATDPPVADPMLTNMPVKDFDRSYVHGMVTDHRQTVQLFEKYIAVGKDPDVLAFARQTLPVLKDHLAAISAIDKTMTDQSTNAQPGTK